MAYETKTDKDLIALNAGHLFESSVTKIAFRRGTYLRSYMYRFMELFAAHLSREMVDAAAQAGGQEEVERLFASVQLPEY